MASRLVPTVLNFAGSRPVAHARTEPCGRPQHSCFGKTPSRPSVASGTQGPTLELQVGEQSTREVPLAEEPDDDMELKLPKLRSLVIMILTNFLLQVGNLNYASGDLG
ncbi:hypothetical protein BC827DRAFT_1240858 [Russula dissimulans]|nr:hypothetical protein BC827DRAFT_1240858 [Russula dissimulans]